MPLDHDTLVRLRAGHPAWRLLVARHAPLIASFLDLAFVQPNERTIAEGSDCDPDARRRELLRRREEIDAELARLDEGHVPTLDDTAVRDRFQQFAALARELLGDFREVEENFRRLESIGSIKDVLSRPRGAVVAL